MWAWWRTEPGPQGAAWAAACGAYGGGVARYLRYGARAKGPALVERRSNAPRCEDDPRTPWCGAAPERRAVAGRAAAERQECPPCPRPHSTATMDAAPVTLEQQGGTVHGEVVLRRRPGGRGRGEAEIIANGCFLMDTSDGRSERLLVDAALAALRPAARPPALLIGGLGVGFSLAHAVADPRWGRSRWWSASGRSSTGIATGPLAALSGDGARRSADEDRRSGSGRVSASATCGHVRRAMSGHRQRARLDRHRGQRQPLLPGRTRRLPGC